MAKRLIAAAVGFIGGGVLSMIFLGLLVSIFDMNFQSVWQGTLAGAVIWSVIGFCFPKLGVKLIELVD
jgi:hypothetical protein